MSMKNLADKQGNDMATGSTITNFIARMFNSISGAVSFVSQREMVKSNNTSFYDCLPDLDQKDSGFEEYDDIKVYPQLFPDRCMDNNDSMHAHIITFNTLAPLGSCNRYDHPVSNSYDDIFVDAYSADDFEQLKIGFIELPPEHTEKSQFRHQKTYNKQTQMLRNNKTTPDTVKTEHFDVNISEDMGDRSHDTKLGLTTKCDLKFADEFGSSSAKMSLALDNSDDKACFFDEVRGRFTNNSLTDIEDSFQIVFSDSPQHSPRPRLISDCDSEDSFIIFENDCHDNCYLSVDVFESDYEPSSSEESDNEEVDPIYSNNLIGCHIRELSRTFADLTDESLHEDAASADYNYSLSSEVQIDLADKPDQDAFDTENGSTKSSNKLLKKVTFSEAPPKVHLMCVWSFAARQARVGDWMQLALDRSRFKQRIANVDMAISWVLKPQHRSRVKFQRFMPWWNAQRRQEEAARKAREQEKLKIGLEAEKLRLENIQNQDSIIDNDVSDVLYEIIGKIDNNFEICKNHTIHGSTNFDSLNTVNGNDYVQVLNSHAPNTANVLSDNNISDLIVSSLDNVDVTSHDKNGKPVNDFLPETSNYSKDFIIKVKNIDLDTSKSDPQIVSMSYIPE